MGSSEKYKVKAVTVSEAKNFASFVAKAAVVVYVLYMVLVVATRKHWNGVRMPFYRIQAQTIQEGDGEAVELGDKIALNITSFDPYSGKKLDLMEISYRVGSGNLMRAIDIGMLGWKGEPHIDIERIRDGETRRILAPKKYCYGGMEYHVEDKMRKKPTRGRHMGNQKHANVFELSIRRLLDERPCTVTQTTFCVNMTDTDYW